MASASSPGGRQAERSNSTRRKLLDAAREAFGTRGYDATPLEELLAATGFSKGAFYHHFADKRELLAAVYENLEAEITAGLAPIGREFSDPLARIDSGCQAFLDACLEPAVRQIALTDAPAVLGWQRWREIDSRFGFGLLLAGLRSAARAGRIPDTDLEVRGHLLLASLMEAALLVGSTEDPKAMREAAGRAISAQIWALAGEDPPATAGKRKPQRQNG